MHLALRRRRGHSSLMRWTCLMLGLLVLTFLPARAGHKPPQVTLRIHIQTTGAGQSAQEVTTITVPPNNEQIQVRTLPEVTEEDLIDVQQDAAGLHLKFNHAGQVNLDAVTAQNQGRILVVLVDGYVIYAPSIDEQISNGRLDIPHPLPAQILQYLQDVARHNVIEANKA